MKSELLFENYWRKTMDEQTRLEFEQQLQNDEALNSDYRQFAKAANAAQMQAITVLKSRMQQSPRSQFGIWIWSVAAGVLVLLLAGVVYYQAPKYTNEILTSQRIQQNFVDRSRSIDKADAPLNEIHKLLADQQHLEAQVLLNEIPDTVNYYPYILHIRGLSALAIDHLDASIKDLLQLKNQQDPRFSEGAQWNLSLAYLRNGQEDLCRKELSEMALDDSHDYQVEAKQLLKNLDSFWRRIY